MPRTFWLVCRGAWSHRTMSGIIDLQRQLLPLLRASKVAECERRLTVKLAALPRSPFHVILNPSITTDPKTVAGGFDEFCRK